MQLLLNFINPELVMGGFNFLLGALPVGYLLIMLARWLFPDLDGYLSRVKPVIAEIDDRLDVLLLEWENHTLETINDIVGEIRSQLRKAGYILDEVDEEKIESHIKASIKKEADKKEGLSLTRDLNEGIRIEYRREF